MKVLHRFILKIFINLHNHSYKIISKLATRLNQGIHPKHEIMKYHQFFVDNVSPDDQVLDLGCGDGANTFDIAQKAKKVIGIDQALENITKAKRNYQRRNLNFILGDATNYKFDQRFNKIVLSNVLEHIKNRKDFLISLHKISSMILIRVPMLTRDWLSVYKQQQGFEYRLDRTHYTEYTLESLNQELKQASWHLDQYSIQFGELWGIVKKDGK